MSTNITSFSDPWSLGALYPGIGTEWIMVLIVTVLWIWWHIWQIRDENAEYREALKLYREVGMERAMHHASAKIASEEEVKAREVQKAMGRQAGH